jgi:hypothetical protein
VARAEIERICSVRCEWPERAFAPVLRDSRGGALVNMLSVLSFISTPQRRGDIAIQALNCCTQTSQRRLFGVSAHAMCGFPYPISTPHRG